MGPSPKKYDQAEEPTPLERGEIVTELVGASTGPGKTPRSAAASANDRSCYRHLTLVSGSGRARLPAGAPPPCSANTRPLEPHRNENWR